MCRLTFIKLSKDAGGFVVDICSYYNFLVSTNTGRMRLKEIEEKMGIKDFYLKSYIRLLSEGNISTVLKTSFHSKTIWNVPRLFVLYWVSEAVPLRMAQSWSWYGQIAVEIYIYIYISYIYNDLMLWFSSEWLSDWWFVAHLADLLFHCNLLQSYDFE